MAAAVLTVVLVTLGLGAGVSPASAATGDIGQLGPSFSGVTNPPTSDKPQSKLWYTDGIWWADMFHAASRTWRIHRLDQTTGQWVDTGVANDGRVNTLADTLWDGTHLYIATHVVTASNDANPKPSLANSPSRLYRYSYSAATKTFTPDAGFPKVISTQSSESLTIDKDSTGTLWATWTQVSGNSTNGFTSTVYVNATTSSDDSWGTPFAMPTAGANPAPDDISAVVAYGGNKVGVMWSNQIDETVYWAVHVDGTATSDWRVAPALRGNKQADDHMNLKALQADQAGRVFAAVKTSADGAPGATSSDPQVLLLVFKPGTAAWTSTVVGTLADCHTRPQVVLDEEHSVVHVVATAPSTAGCPAPGTAGTIYDKSAPMDDPVFLAGRGTPIIRDAASANMNNPTSTKQSVTGASGLIVLASNTSTARYWHADLALGASADTTAPSTPGSLSATAASSTRVDLTWTASSDAVGVTGYRVYRNGSTAPLASVGSGILTYSDTTVAGGTSYTYQVSAVDAAGNESGRATASVATPTSAPQTLTFTPTDDATIDASAPTLNAGTSNRVGIDGSPVNRALFKFAVTGTADCTVTSARLRLTVGSTNNDQSAYGGDVYGVADTGWSESTVTWGTRPAADTTKVGSISSSVALNGTYTVDVTSLVNGDGLVSMQLSTANSDAARYWSKDGATATQAPQLQLTCEGTPAPAPQTLTFTPTHDATIDASAPTLNSGTSNRVGIDGSPVNRALFKFAVTDTAGCTVTSARLRLTVGSTNNDQSAYGGDVYGVADTSWSESTVTWGTRPAADTTKVGSISSSVALNGTYTVDVTSLVKGDGLVSMQLSTANSDAARYWSKDGATATQVPQLQVTCG